MYFANRFSKAGFWNRMFFALSATSSLRKDHSYYGIVSGFTAHLAVLRFQLSGGRNSRMPHLRSRARRPSDCANTQPEPPHRAKSLKARWRGSWKPWFLGTQPFLVGTVSPHYLTAIPPWRHTSGPLWPLCQRLSCLRCRALLSPHRSGRRDTAPKGRKSPLCIFGLPA